MRIEANITQKMALEIAKELKSMVKSCKSKDDLLKIDLSKMFKDDISVMTDNWVD